MIMVSETIFKGVVYTLTFIMGFDRKASAEKRTSIVIFLGSHYRRMEPMKKLYKNTISTQLFFSLKIPFKKLVQDAIDDKSGSMEKVQDAKEA